MGKKIPTEMSKQKEKFTEGAVKNGMAQVKAEELFKLIEPFAAYGFNKAHAASYAVIAYQTAYMKSNYPVEFMTAVMSAESDDTDKIAAAVAECAKMNIPVLPPQINKSETGFTIEESDGKKRAIRFGLSAIKNVGKAAIEAILSEHAANGDFKSIDEFVRRVNMRVVNRKTLESLIKAGAMDSFGKRNAMLKILDELKSSGQTLSKVSTGQESLFDKSEMEKHAAASFKVASSLSSIEEASKEEVLSWERELLGFYLTEHPLSKIASKLEEVISIKIADLDSQTYAGKVIKVGGIIAQLRKTLTKVRQEEMCFLKVQDTTGSIDVVVFPRVYAEAKQYILTDQIVIVSGKFEVDEQSTTLLADKILTLEMALASKIIQNQVLEVSVPQTADRILLSKIYEALRSNPGQLDTYLVLPTASGALRKFQVPFTAKRSSQLEETLIALGCKIIN